LGSLLAALATIVVSGLALLLAVPHFIEWNEYRAQFETQAAKLFGRPVAIQGDIDLTILPIPRLSIRGLTVSDEFGKFEQPFAEIEEFTAVLALPSLLRGTIEADRIKLDQPVVRLKIDEFGEGSWQSVGPSGLVIPLPVRDVVLNDVAIKDGAIEIRRDVGAVGRLDRISGTFSADSLSGPFRFNGVGAFGGDPKEIKLAAVRAKDKPAVRVKGSLRSLDGVSLYQLDGEVKGLDGLAYYEGPVAARLALDAKAKTAVADQLTEAMPGKAIEMRAAAKITLDEAKLDKISLTMTQNDRPQSVTGWAHASWGGKPRLDLAIEAGFLDIDQMLRMESKTEVIPPSTALGALPRLFEGWSFRPQQGRITAKIQQASLGGDVVEGINFAASHDHEGWKVDTLVARLPGDTDADVKGTLPAGESLAFNGSFELKGRNLSRLLRWSAPSLGVVETGDLENFSLSSSMTFSTEQLSFRNARGSLGTSSFTGDLVHDYGANSRLLLALESEELDLRTLYSSQEEEATGGEGGSHLQDKLTKAANGGTAEAAVPATKTTLLKVLATVFKAEQSNVSLSVSKLQLPDFEARDLRTAFRYEKGSFDFRELNVASTDGLNVKASGRISGFDSRPNGALKLTIDAPSAQSVTNLARLTGLDSMSSGARRRIEALSPFQLNGSLNAVAAQSSVKLTLAGTAGGSELTFNGQMRGNFEQFGDANINIEGGIGNADGRRLIAQLAPEVPLDKASESGPGFVKIAAMGAVKSGLASRIQLQTPQARGQFSGEIGLLSEPAWSLNGDLEMRASQAATALSMLRLSPGGTPVTGAIDLRASITKKAAQYQVSQLELAIGEETMRGSVEVDTSGERPSAKIDISASAVSVPKIAAYLVDWDREDLTAQIAEVASGLTGVWPERSFALASLQAMDGTLQVKAPVFQLADGVQLTDGSLKATLARGSLNVSALKGDIYGGTASVSGTLQALKGRAGFSGKIELKGADVAALGRAHGGTPVASGKMDLKLALEGQGLSPRGLVTVVSGDGEMTLSKGAVNGLSPAVLKTAAATYLKQEIPDKDRLAVRLKGDLRKGRLEYPRVTVPVAVIDGVLKLNPADLRGDDYVAKVSALVDLGTLRFDSEWLIDSQAKTEDGYLLPPVRLTFAGPIAQFSAVEARLDTDEFARFLTMKRMDQDMQKLEKLDPLQAPAARGPQGSDQRAAPQQQPSETSSVQETGATIPSQSLLRAPAGAADPVLAPPSSPTLLPRNARRPRPEPDPAPPAVTGWSTGTEAAPAQTGTAEPVPQQSEAQPPADFEATIREVLRSQQNSDRPAYQ
jgi:uncharacterized protein involved in outer membrane biogenesis